MKQRKKSRILEEFCFFFFVGLFCAEDAVAGVAEAGNDVAVIVEFFVQGGTVQRDVRMVTVQALDAFRSGNQVHAADFLCAVLLEEGDGGGCRAAVRSYWLGFLVTDVGCLAKSRKQ